MHRKILRSVCNGSKINLEEHGLLNQKITHLYTIISEQRLFTVYDTQTGEPWSVTLQNANISHGHSVFVEDILHDWHVQNGFLHLHTHSSERDEQIDILVETE